MDIRPYNFKKGHYMKQKRTNKNVSATWTYLLLAVLVCIIFASIFFAESNNAQVAFEPAPAEEAAEETPQPVNAEAEPTPEVLPTPGTRSNCSINAGSC